MPGYVLAKLAMNDNVYHLIKNTPKVTGFLGANNKPQPISDREAARYFGAPTRLPPLPSSEISVNYEIGDSVKVLRRPLRQLQRRGGRARLRQEQGRGLGFDLWPGDPGRAGLRAGRTGQVRPVVKLAVARRARAR